MIQVSDKPATASGAHYAHCVTAGSFSFLSGQLPVLPGGDLALVDADFAAQFQQVLANVQLVLSENELRLSDIVKVTIYLDDIVHWPACNDLYRDFFGDHKPARTIVPVGPLHFGFKVELDAIAYREPR